MAQIVKTLPTMQSAEAQPRGANPCPRSGQRPRVPGCIGTGAAKRSYATSEVRGGSREELPHARGQGRQPRRATPHPRSSGCVGAGGPRGATPCSRSGGLAVRRYPSSKVRSSSCTLLECRKEISHVQGKRNPSKMVSVSGGHQRADTLKP